MTVKGEGMAVKTLCRRWKLVAVISIVGMFAGSASALAGAAVTAARSSASDLAAIAPDTADAELALLADGVVTDQELRMAQEGAAACMRAAGLDAQVEGRGIGVRGNPGEAGSAAIKRCGAAHLDRIALEWGNQHRPDSALRQAVLAETSSCFLAATGRAGQAPLSRQQLSTILTSGADEEAVALGNCLQANMDKYGFAF